MPLREVGKPLVWDAPTPRDQLDYAIHNSEAAKRHRSDRTFTDPFVNPHIWGVKPGDYIRAARAALAVMRPSDIREAQRRLIKACETLDSVLDHHPGLESYRYPLHGVSIVQAEIKAMLAKLAA